MITILCFPMYVQGMYIPSAIQNPYLGRPNSISMPILSLSPDIDNRQSIARIPSGASILLHVLEKSMWDAGLRSGTTPVSNVQK